MLKVIAETTHSISGFARTAIRNYRCSFAQSVLKSHGFQGSRDWVLPSNMTF